MPSLVALFHLGIAVSICSATAQWLGSTARGASHHTGRIRTVVTTDMEQDDLTSMIRYLLYTPDLDTQGIIYSASRYHWEGDYRGTEFYLPGREYTTPQTSFRWTGNTTIQDVIIPAYAEVYPNLKVHDPRYPTPEHLLSLVKIGNVDFEGEFNHDSEGSDLIKSLILDHDPRNLYLQAWGGTNTIARALKSIADESCEKPNWSQIQAHVSRKVVIMASGFQDNTYDEYISIAWPDLQVRNSGVAWTAYNCNINGTGNRRGLSIPDDHVYFTGDWIKLHIQIGPYGRLYRSWLDGQHMLGDPLDVFGNTSIAPIKPTDWCQPLSKYDFLGEGDDGTFLPLLTTCLQNPADPNLGGWGGRSERNASVSANLWESVAAERAPNGTLVPNFGTDRFMGAAQNDMAARIQWTLTSEYMKANHPPSVRILNGDRVSARPGAKAELHGAAQDPDGDRVALSWWQYVEEGTYNGTVSVTSRAGGSKAVVEIPAAAKAGQTISVILQGTDDGDFPLTRYDRAIIIVS